MTLFEKLIHALLWLRIAISPTLIGAVVGLIICAYLGVLNIALLATCVVIGFICGALWAERVRKKIGLGLYFR